MKKEVSEKFNINKYSSIFFWVGVNISLLLIITAFEWESVYETNILENRGGEPEFVEIIPITKMEEPKPPKPKAIAPKLIETTEEIEDIIFEVILDPDDLDSITNEDLIGDDNPPIEEIDIYENGLLDAKAEPLSGYAGFYKFIRKHLKYPRAARQLEIEGRVFVSFVIDEQGKLTDITIIRGIGGGCDEETLRVMRLIPAWKPGIVSGRPVKARMALPITFKLGK